MFCMPRDQGGVGSASPHQKASFHKENPPVLELFSCPVFHQNVRLKS